MDERLLIKWNRNILCVEYVGRKIKKILSKSNRVTFYAERKWKGLVTIDYNNFYY